MSTSRVVLWTMGEAYVWLILKFTKIVFVSSLQTPEKFAVLLFFF